MQNVIASQFTQCLIVCEGTGSKMKNILLASPIMYSYVNTPLSHRRVGHNLATKQRTDRSWKILQMLVAQLCLTLGKLMDCSPPGSSVHGIFQA